MKLLAATSLTQGWREDDFCWTTPGELVYFGIDAGCGKHPDGKCGCGRSMVGLQSFKSTTTMQVVQSQLSEADLRRLLTDSLKLAGFFPKPATVRTLGEELQLAAIAFNTGDIVERRGKKIELRRIDCPCWAGGEFKREEGCSQHPYDPTG